MRLKQGDRFFYELGGQPGSFTLGKINKPISATSWVTHVYGDFILRELSEQSEVKVLKV